MAWPMNVDGCPSVRQRQEMTIAEMLSDSIVQALMEADRVDPNALEAFLRGLARKLEHDPEKACPRVGGGGHRFLEKIMLHH